MAVPASVGILATGVVFVATSFAVGLALDTIDESNGYTKEFTKVLKEYFE
ncbi:hypothetical protein GNP59_18525 [Aliivibrio fischeri]|nr:hypothetical protein [Aliivibrio fischeri]MUL15126.1 hypothetical protein [Aliivibrio fischeri]